MNQPTFLDHLPRFAFFTGKGGVGKTSATCATALALADQGKSVLLVSTDPASNIGQVFDQHIGNQITTLNTAPGIDALEIDPEAAAATYRESIIKPVRGLLPKTEIQAMTEQLSGACTTEIASFNEFADLIADPDLTSDYDHVLLDTAPTGHTIRLLELPGDWSQFIDEGKGDASCLGPMAGLESRRSVYQAAVNALSDPARTVLVLVARAQRSAIHEAERTSRELAALGMGNQHLLINALMPDLDGDSLAAAIRDQEHKELASLPSGLARLPYDTTTLHSRNVVGINSLREFFTATPTQSEQAANHVREVAGKYPPLADLVDQLAAQTHGLFMTLGKGGVGKTTVATAIAVALAERGRDVLLTTTDPAGNLTETLNGTVANLTIAKIDPDQALREYQNEVLATKGTRLDATGRAQLMEDLQSPCTQEVAVFRKFSEAIREAYDRIVVIDTAPSGHTLLLLDATGSYHREMLHQMGDNLVATPLTRLQDPDYTKMIIVTLPETTPVLEAEQLQRDLERASITPWAWVVNRSVAAAHPASAFLQTVADGELPQIKHVQHLTERMAVVPLLPTPPIGQDILHSLSQSAPLARSASTR
ncbi:arsenical pump-driving ATPase [Bifidobacterium tibiigranuli]|jgi:arsenite-transporting ATPase|uniref:arsenical pump-driving ATPase n=1 Tax=Bifidobacterium tibiigranuli TaxID=2172043 RepID=UPI002353E3C6|nr:arsenical pump-driving ATPase [Bifidobacterium tibiigranuli]MCH3973662.1 arsenical pump-driving ATPase [Bifidobacterium tibiigranuli]